MHPLFEPGHLIGQHGVLRLQVLRQLSELLALLLEVETLLHQQLLALQEHLEFVFHDEDPVLAGFGKVPQGLVGVLPI